MTNNERKMVSQLLALCEKQYRKGIQHGAIEALESGSTKSADAFRFKGVSLGYKKHDWYNWPGAKEEGAKEFAMRMAAECPGGDELSMLLIEYGETKGSKDIRSAYDIVAHGKEFEPSH